MQYENVNFCMSQIQNLFSVIKESWEKHRQRKQSKEGTQHFHGI